MGRKLRRKVENWLSRNLRHKPSKATTLCGEQVDLFELDSHQKGCSECRRERRRLAAKAKTPTKIAALS